MNDDMTNPVMNEIESLTGGSLATTVAAPKNQQTIVGGGSDLKFPEMSQDFGVQPSTQVVPNIQEQPAEQNSVVGSGVQQPTESLEEVMDPVSYNRRRFQKVQPYTVTMPNGDQFETTSLDKDKILYDYYKSLRSDPRMLGTRESTIDRANKSYFGYAEVPEGVTESFFGAFGRAFVNLYTNRPADLFNTSAIATFSTISNNPYLTDEQKQEARKILQKEIEAGINVKNDLTAHPSAHWVDVKETGWSKVGAELGNVVADIVPAFLTGGASIGINMTERAAVKAATKAASKRLGKEAGKDAAETMGKRATNIKNLSREFKRNPQFDPSMAKKSLALTYTNKIANGLNYGMAAGEAADAAVEVYLDALNKTNDFDYAANRALQAGSIVGVLGASPEWVHGAYGALTGASRRMWKAAVAGDKAVLRRMVAGDIAGSFGLEGTSEVAQDVTTLGYMNKPVDPKEEFMTFMLAGIMAGTVTGISNYGTPSRAIENATEFKQQFKDVLKIRADIFNKIMGPESAYIIRDEDIDKLMDIVDDPNFDTLAEKIIKKGILENVDKIENMEDADKKALKERLESENYDASVQAFMDFDKTIDDVVLSNDTELTPAQRVIFKSIMHGVAQFAIISGRISNPNELLGEPNGLNTGGTESYVENGNAYIATARGINRAPYQAGEVEVNPRGNAAQQLSARINNQIENSATKGMSQGAVDILHEVLGHLFASDVVADGDLPHFMIRYTELLEEAIKEVMPSVVIDENTPVEALDEYRAYAMANSTKIAEMLGFTGDTAKLFKFFEQMTLANRANFGAIKEYVDTLRTMLIENSEAIRGLIDSYGEDVSGAIKHYADTGDAGMLTNEDLKALSRIFETGLADSDAKLDLMSAIGDSSTYQKLTDRLGTRFNKAVEQDRADVARTLSGNIKQAQDEIKNSERAPINEEAVEALDKLSKKQVNEDADFLNNMPNEEASEIENIRQQLEALDQQIMEITDKADAEEKKALASISSPDESLPFSEQTKELIKASEATKAAEKAREEAYKQAEPLRKQRNELQKKLDKLTKKQKKTMVNNQVTFDGKKYYYLTKKPLVMPNPKAVQAVQHTKEEGEPESVDNETYRASQLATTGLTQGELDAFTNWSLNQIKLNAPAGVFDELMKQINQVIDSDVELIPLPNNDDYGRRAGYEFKFVGELQLGNSKMIFDENTVFSNANQRTSALSSDIAYYVMAKRAAKADNKRYSVRAINSINSTVGKYLENNPEKRDVLDDIAGRLADYESQYQYSGFVASNDKINTSEYVSLLRDLRDTLIDNNIDIRVNNPVYRGRIDDEKLKDLGDWYNNFYTRLEKENNITKLKEIVKDKLALAKNETSELDALPTKDAVLEFVHQHANNFKYLPKTRRTKNATADKVPLENATDYEMHSGGAIGADSVWGEEARKLGIKVNHYYAEGNKTPQGNQPVSKEELEVAKTHVLRANETLKRDISNISGYVLGLLERNYEQVKNSDAIFAVSEINGTQVKGGTGWAVQMAIDENKPVYVYDQVKRKWFEYNYSTAAFEELDSVPVLTRSFAGIGARKINEAGKKAIADVFKNSFGKTNVEPQSFLDIIDEEIINTVQDENAKTRDVSAWYDPAKKVKLTAEQKKFLKLGKKIAMSEEDRDKLISAYLKTRPELHTNKDESALDVFTSVNLTESGDVLTLDEGEQVPYTMSQQGEQDEQVEQVEASKPVNKKYQSIAEKIDSLFGESGVKEYTPITNYEAQIGYAALSSTVNSDEGVNLMPVKYTTPEEYGFKSARQMQAVFRAYEVPSMTFDIDKYLYNPRTGKVNKKGVIDYSDFLYDFAEMAKAQLAARGLDNGDGLSFANKLAYVKAVIDANNAARQAYSEYVKEVAKRANEHGLRSSTENQLLNDEGYEKFASVEEVKNNDNDLMKSMLFKELGKRPLFSFFDGDGKMYPTFNTKYLELGRVVRFPYGQNPRMGVIVGAFPVVPGMYSETHDMLYLFRTVANLKNGIKYEEFYIPRSDFVEMTRDNGKQFMVSDGTFDEIGLAWFNKYFDEKLANQNKGKTTKFDEFVRIVDATTPADVKENPEQYYARTGGSNNRRYAVRKTITPEMADLIKSFTPDDSEYDADIDPETLKYMKARDVSRNLASFAFSGTVPGQQMSQADYRQALEAYDLSKNISRKPVATFASEPFMGTMNIIDYMNDLTNKVNESTSKANKTKLSGLINRIPLFLGSQSGTGRVWRMVIGEDPSVRSLEESAQRMTEASETATQQLQAEIATTLKNKGGAQSFNDYFRNRLKNSPIKARLFNANGEEVDITMGEIQNLYAAKLIEETKVNGKYKYEQKIIDGGNNIYSRLKKTFANADELVGQLSETDKFVVEAMLDFFAKYVKTQQKRFALSLGSYAKSVEKGWAARSQYFTRATKAEMTDQNSLLVVDDLFDTLNADFKANAIYNSGVKKDLTTMKNMLTFGLKYMNAEEGMSGYERFLEDFKLNGDLDENSEDFKTFQNMLAASNAFRQAVKQALGNFGFERFMKRLDFESTQPEKAFNLLPSGIGKVIDQFTRTSMASKLAFKPKNALQNFVGAWQRCCPLSDNTLRWYTTDLLDAIINYKDAIESAKDNAFIGHRLERNALGAEYQKVTDASSAESLLAELSIKAANLKKKGSVTASQVFALLDDFAKKMTKISVSYGTSGADFLALAFAWYKLKPGLQKQALAIQKANAGSGKGLVTAETLFMNHVLRNISSSNFMTRSPLQNWAIRNHVGALTAFLNDSLQSYSAIGEAWYGLHNAKTDEEKRYLRRVITSNIASQLFYIATQIGAFSALYGWVATDDGLTEAEQEYLWDSMLREFVGQLSSITAFDVVTRPLLETALLKEKRQSGNILVSALQDVFADLHDFDTPKLLADTLDMLGGFAGTNRAIDVADALWSAYNQDDESYRAVGEVLYGRTKKTALKIQGLRENSKGEVVNKK